MMTRIHLKRPENPYWSQLKITLEGLFLSLAGSIILVYGFRMALAILRKVSL